MSLSKTDPASTTVSVYYTCGTSARHSLLHPGSFSFGRNDHSKQPPVDDYLVLLNYIIVAVSDSWPRCVEISCLLIGSQADHYYAIQYVPCLSLFDIR